MQLPAAPLVGLLPVTLPTALLCARPRPQGLDQLQSPEVPLAAAAAAVDGAGSMFSSWTSWLATSSSAAVGGSGTSVGQAGSGPGKAVE